MSIQVQTAHNVVIDYKVSDSWKRTLAYIIDLIIIGIWYIICIAFIVPYSIIKDSLSELQVGFYLLCLIPIAVYDLAFEYLNNGQSIGKVLLKMRVINVDGSYPSFPSYVIRWLFRPIDFTMTFGTLAFVLVGFTKKSQRLGDIVAGTTVIDLQVERANRSLSISELNFDKRYNVSYPNLLSVLSDKDLQVIVSILRESEDIDAIGKLAIKIEEITGYKYDRTRINGVDEYLRTIVNDYHYLGTRS